MRRKLGFNLSKKQVILVLYLFGLIIGTLFFNLCNSAYLEEMGIFKNSFIDKFQSLSISNIELFQYIFPKRFKTFIILIGLQITSLGLPVLLFYSSYYGFASGILISALSIGYGIKGIFYFVSCLFPHYIIYLCIWILILRKMDTIRKNYNVLDFGFSFFFLLFLLLLGVFAESFLNTAILKTLLENTI